MNNEENKNQAKPAPKVTPAEVSDWEEKFRKSVSSLGKFDKQDNGFSMKFYNGQSGVDAYWSGNIILKADNYIKWNYSVTNGVFAESKINLDDSNSKIISNLYDFYKMWSEDVSKTITEPEGEKENPEENPSNNTSTGAGPESPNAPVGAPTPELNMTNPLQESAWNRRNKGRESVILSASDRMKRLAGLD